MSHPPPVCDDFTPLKWQKNKCGTCMHWEEKHVKSSSPKQSPSKAAAKPVVAAVKVPGQSSSAASPKTNARAFSPANTNKSSISKEQEDRGGGLLQSGPLSSTNTNKLSTAKEQEKDKPGGLIQSVSSFFGAGKGKDKDADMTPKNKEKEKERQQKEKEKERLQKEKEKAKETERKQKEQEKRQKEKEKQEREREKEKEKQKQKQQKDEERQRKERASEAERAAKDQQKQDKENSRKQIHTDVPERSASVSSNKSPTPGESSQHDETEPQTPTSSMASGDEDTGYSGGKEGWMQKKPEHSWNMLATAKKWNMRWFRLQEGSLLYFVNKPQPGEKANKQIELRGYVAELVEDSALLKQVGREGELVLFRLRDRKDDNRRTYTFCADSEEELVDWIQNINFETYREFNIKVHSDAPVPGVSQDSLQTLEGLEQPGERTKMMDQLGIDETEIQRLKERQQRKKKLKEEILAAMAAEDEEIRELQKMKAEREALRNKLLHAQDEGAVAALEEAIKSPKPRDHEPERARQEEEAQQQRRADAARREQEAVARKKAEEAVAAEQQEARAREAAQARQRAEEEQRRLAEEEAALEAERQAEQQKAQEAAAKAQLEQQRAAAQAKEKAEEARARKEREELDRQKQKQEEATRRQEEQEAERKATAALAAERELKRAKAEEERHRRREELEARKRKVQEERIRLEAETARHEQEAEAARRKEEAVRLEQQRKAKQEEEAAKRRKEQEEEAAKRRKEQEEAAKRRKEQEEEAAKRRKEQEEAAKKRKEQEEEEARKRRAQEEAAASKQKLAEAKAKRDAEEAARTRAAEEELRKRKEAEAARRQEAIDARKKQEDEAAERKKMAEERKRQAVEAENARRKAFEEKTRQQKEEEEKAASARSRQSSAAQPAVVDGPAVTRPISNSLAATPKSSLSSTPTASSVSRTPQATSVASTPKASSISSTPKATSVANTPKATSVANTPKASAGSGKSLPPIQKMRTPGPGQQGALLYWCQLHCDPMGVDVGNFTKAWQDGRAFAALVAYWRPDLINPADLDPSDKEGSLNKAFQAAEKAGVSVLLDAEDIAEIPDKRSIICQLTMYHRDLSSLPEPSHRGDGGGPAAAPSRNNPRVKKLVNEVKDIDQRYKALTEASVAAGEGDRLYKELKECLPEIKELRQDHDDDLRATVTLYNTLNKDIPKKVNGFLEAIQKKGGNKGTDAKHDGKCSVCKKPLSGETVEALGTFFHKACFKCSGCGRKFAKTCLNIQGKPYCDGCGRKAFVSSTAK